MRGLEMIRAAALAATVLVAPAAVQAAGPGSDIPSRDWSFEGIFGTFDEAAAQRGFMVYQDACASCHSLSLVYFRNLVDIGVSPDAARAIASNYNIEDGPDDTGEMFERPGRLSDAVPDPFPNEQAARAANAGAYPPDLSLMVKAREPGADYLYALLTGYTDPPADVDLPPGMYYNEYFSGNQIAMAPPLMEGLIDYPDGTEATVEQMAHDVTMFLAFAAEPRLEERKRTGVAVVLFLVVLSLLLYMTKRKVWANVH